jgi:hypothetical protein
MWSFLKHYDGAQPGKRKTASKMKTNFKKSEIVANQKQELPLVAIFVGRTGRNEETLEDLTQMLSAKIGSIWPSCFRGDKIKM